LWQLICQKNHPMFSASSSFSITFHLSIHLFLQGTRKLFPAFLTLTLVRGGWSVLLQPLWKQQLVSTLQPPRTDLDMAVNRKILFLLGIKPIIQPVTLTDIFFTNYLNISLWS
jgi:hypothetical protein